MNLLAQARSAANSGTGIAIWADSPGKLALVWIGGLVVLVAVVVLLVKMKMDKG